MVSPGPDSVPGADEWVEINRASWDEVTPIHVASSFYGVEEFRRGGGTLRPFELAEMGPLSGLELLHLQCHFGLDTLTLARAGAVVTGLDFSAPAVTTARALAAEVGLDAARFVTADVYDAREVLEGGFDVVYTGKGALCWLPDMERWAGVVASLLRPGGFVYLVEYHPLLFSLADEELAFEYPYFNEGPIRIEDEADYAEPGARLTNSVTIEWAHPISEVVTALVSEGLELEFLHELPECGYRRFPFLVELEPRGWVAPPHMPQLPMTYSLRARKKTR